MAKTLAHQQSPAADRAAWKDAKDQKDEKDFVRRSSRPGATAAQPGKPLPNPCRLRPFFLEIVYFQYILQSALAIVGVTAYIDSMLSNRNAYDSGSFGAAVDKICIFESAIKICSSVVPSISRKSGSFTVDSPLGFASLSPCSPGQTAASFRQPTNFCPMRKQNHLRKEFRGKEPQNEHLCGQHGVFDDGAGS